MNAHSSSMAVLYNAWVGIGVGTARIEGRSRRLGKLIGQGWGRAKQII